MAPNQPAPTQDPRTPQPAEGVHVSRPQETVSRPVQPAPNAEPVAVPASLVLPPSVVSRSDLSRSLRELKSIEDYFHQAAIRGSEAQELSTTSKILDSLATANGMNLLNADHRAQLKTFLTKLKATAPVVHMSFPSEASAPFLARILEWFRAEAHPHVVLHVGLQPELAAGCLVRTTNKMFDFSFRKRFEESKQKLMQSLEALDKAADRMPVADANATVAPGDRLTTEQVAAPQPPQTPGEAAV